MIGPPEIFSTYVVQRQCLTVDSFYDLLMTSTTLIIHWNQIDLNSLSNHKIVNVSPCLQHMVNV